MYRSCRFQIVKLRGVAGLSVAGGLAGLIYPVVCGHLFVAFAENLNGFGYGLAVAISGAHWLVAVGLATLLAVHWPSFPGTTIGVYGLVGGFLILLLYYFAGASGLPVVADIAYTAFPAGWLQCGSLDGRTFAVSIGAWWGAVPTGFVVVAGAASLPKLLGSYRIRNFIFQPGLPAIAESDSWTARTRSLDFRIFPRLLGQLGDAPLERGGARLHPSAIRCTSDQRLGRFAPGSARLLAQMNTGGISSTAGNGEF